MRFTRKPLNVAALVAGSCLVIVAAAIAGNPETPKEFKGATVCTSSEAKGIVANGGIIVDTRIANEYAESHIQGAVSVVYKENSAKDVKFDPSQDSFDLSKLPGNKNAVIVFYCNGPTCWKSYKATVTAVKAGYKKVYWLREGIPGWKAAGFPVE